ncbi:DNA cytosine methyltransferase [Pandoraea sputorum]|uniref:DNA cytosine methyltransferase n=1 Tax=Pandoraea sputorum TaxID=93222 RepID=UPI002AF6B80C|nr:DNA cytosine methyltransferase [Pandoraea sputorum]
MSGVYYNELDPYAADWLRNLIAAGHITPGDIDTRDIRDVRPDDLRGYTQRHFFAGIGVWSYALRLAGWPDDRPVWTGSCPCQPFSAAGSGLGFADERHLWPHWFHLISECMPSVVLGEQVASKDVDAWIDLVQDDMEGLGNAFGALAFPAASVGSPNIRDRTYWMAHSDSKRGRRHARAVSGTKTSLDRARFEDGSVPVGSRDGGPDGRLADAPSKRRDWRADSARIAGRAIASSDGPVLGLGNASRAGLEGHTWHDGAAGREGPPRPVATSGLSIGMADADLDRQPQGRLSVRSGRSDETAPIESGHGKDVRPGPTNGFWRDADWLFCRDGKWRPVEPGTFPLAHGATARVGRLRAYGNAINAGQAAEFIRCADEAIEEIA